MEPGNQIHMVLQNLQSQLNGISSYLDKAQKPSVGTSNLLDVSSLVKAQVQEEIAKYKESDVKQKELANKPESAAMRMGLNVILPVIGNAFTEEQQLWLSNPSTLANLPSFFAAQSGKETLQIMLEEFKNFLNPPKN